MACKHTIIADNAGGHYMQAGEVDLCIVGTDRVTANGDVANKIGTYLKALAANDNAVPFYVALPSSTIDWTLTIRPRHSDRGTLVRRAPEDDGTPAGRRACDGRDRRTRKPRRQSRLRCDAARLVTGFITERGTCAATADGLLSLFPERKGKA